ncbi:hypothetical protein Pcinc_000024 [Petrolisthes cinctipes]|uniref:Uncharacterized protein n=1 Tax=Petrolisthes cinctipes TaxID=88211 RepID=A0AAE1GP18_PETCI|nr:hypothetical protein Pcinc_000024 [Petrolisthes cinctipes]
MVWRQCNRDSTELTAGGSRPISELQMDRLHDRLHGLKEGGMSAANIAVELGVAESTVHKWWRRWLEEGNLRDHPRSGAPKNTTAEEDQRFLAAVEENPQTNAVALRDNLQLQISAYTSRKIDGEDDPDDPPPHEAAEARHATGHQTRRDIVENLFA